MLKFLGGGKKKKSKSHHHDGEDDTVSVGASSFDSYSPAGLTHDSPVSSSGTPFSITQPDATPPSIANKRELPDQSASKNPTLETATLPTPKSQPSDAKERSGSRTSTAGNQPSAEALPSSRSVPDFSKSCATIEGTEEESDDEGSHAGDGLGTETKKKKKGKFGLKVPKAIKNVAHMGSSSKSSKEGTQRSSSVNEPQSGLSNLSKVEGGDTEGLLMENQRLQASHEEMKSFLEARTFTLRQMEKARNDDEKNFKQQLQTLRDELEVTKTRAEALQIQREMMPDHSDLSNRMLVDEMSAKNKALGARVADLETQAVEAGSTIATLEMTNKSTARQLEQINRSKQSLEEELETARFENQQIQVLMKEKEEIFNKSHTASDSDSASQATVALLQADIARLTSEKSSLEESERMAKAARASAVAAVEELEAQREQMAAELTSSRDVEQRALQAKTLMIESVEANSKEREALEEKCRHLQLENNRLKDVQLLAEDEKAGHLKAELESLREETDALYTELTKMNRQNEELMHMISTYRAAADKLEESLSEERIVKERLESELATAKIVAQRSTAELSKSAQLESQKESLNSEVQQLKDQIAKLSNQSDELATQSHELKRERDNAVMQLAALKDSLQQHNNEEDGTLVETIAQLEAEKAGLTSDLAASHGAQAAAEIAKRKAADDLAAAVQQSSILRSTITEMEVESSSVKDELLKATEALNAKVLEAERASQREVGVSKELLEIRGKLKEAETARDANNLNLIKLQTDNESNMKLLEQRSKDVAELRSSIEQLERQTIESRHVTTESSSEIERLQSLLKKRETESGSRLRSLQADLDTSADRIRIATKESETVRAELVSTKKELSLAKQELEKLSSERLDLSRRTGDLGVETRTLQTQLYSKEQEIQQLSSQLENTKQNRQLLSQKLEEAHARITESQISHDKELLNLRDELLAAETQITSTRKELQSGRVENSSLESQLQAAHMERDVLRTSAQNFKEQLKAFSDSSSAITAREFELQKKVAELQVDLEVQEIKLKAVVNREASLKLDLDAKREELEANRVRTSTDGSRTQTRISELEIECAELKRKNQKMQVSSSSLAQESLLSKDQWKTDVDGLTASVESLEKKIKTLESKNKDLQTESEKADSRRSELMKQVSSLEEQLKQANSSISLPSFGRNPDSTTGSNQRSSHAQQSAERIAQQQWVGTLLVNTIVAGSNIPKRVQLVDPETERPTRKESSVVCVLKSRLLECLFDKANPGAPSLPQSLFGNNIGGTSKTENGRPMVARVLSRVQKLWELAEDLRLALVQADVSLSEKYLQSKTAAGDWMETVESLRGSAQIIEERNEKLEGLCNNYLYAAKEARAAAQLEREKHKTMNSNCKKRVQHLTDTRNQLIKEKNELLAELNRLKQGLDLTIEENRYLQEGHAKYLTTLPYVKDTVDNLKTQLASMNRSSLPPTSLSAPRGRGFDRLSTYGDSPQALTTGARRRMTADKFSANLSAHPNQGDTPIQMSSRLPVADRGSAVVWSQQQYGKLGPPGRTPMSMATAPSCQGRFDESTPLTMDRASWPKGSSIVVAPSSSPAISFGAPNGSGGRISGTGATRSTSPLRLSPLGHRSEYIERLDH